MVNRNILRSSFVYSAGINALDTAVVLWFLPERR
jgi:hypothetical protein